MNQLERNALMNLHKREYTRLEQIKVNCGTCEYGIQRGWCHKFDAAPPPDVPPVGCVEWTYDFIPF